MIKTSNKHSIVYLLLLYISLLTPGYAQNTEHNNQRTSEENIQYRAAESPSNSASNSPANTTHSSLVKPDEARELSMFFKIGIGINIIMLIAYISWAVRQWRQSNNKDD